jgi:hypothetical protein
MGEMPDTRVLQTIENPVKIVMVSNVVSKTDKGYIYYSLAN